jgi:hypothetical protein
MTSDRHSRLGRIAAIALVGVVAVACSGPDDSTTGPNGSAATTVPAPGSLVPGSDPTTSGGGSVAPSGSDPASSVPGTEAGGTSSVLPPQPTGQGAVVTVVTVAPQPATPIGTPAADAGGLQFRIDSVEAVDGEASGPGEIGGPALQVTLSATNTSSAPIDLSLTLVDLRHGADQVPASPFSLGTTPFAGALAPGATASGVYVFGVPVERRAQVRIYVNAQPELPAVVFEGPAG